MVGRDTDALTALLGTSLLRSLRRRYQTKVSVATFVSVSATGKARTSDLVSRTLQLPSSISGTGRESAQDEFLHDPIGHPAACTDQCILE